MGIYRMFFIAASFTLITYGLYKSQMLNFDSLLGFVGYIYNAIPTIQINAQIANKTCGLEIVEILKDVDRSFIIVHYKMDGEPCRIHFRITEFDEEVDEEYYY